LSRIRKSLFDVLGAEVVASCFLDLYAGSGAVGIGALSRGARRATFVERDRTSLRILRDNLTVCDVLGQSDVVSADVLITLPFLLRDHHYDLVFVGPPYYQHLAQETLTHIERCPGSLATVVIQTARQETIQVKRQSPFTLRQRKDYGDTRLWFLEVKI